MVKRIFLALAIGAFFATPGAVAIARRYGPRRVVTIGMALEAGGIVVTTLLISPTVTGFMLAIPLFVAVISVLVNVVVRFFCSGAACDPAIWFFAPFDKLLWFPPWDLQIGSDTLASLLPLVPSFLALAFIGTLTVLLSMSSLELSYGRDFRLESVPNALEQARQAAAAICGRPEPAPEVPWFWSDQYDLKLQIAGMVFDPDTTVVRGDVDAARFAVFHLKAGRIQAVEAVNAPAEFMGGKLMIARGAIVDPARLADLAISMKEVAA